MQTGKLENNNKKKEKTGIIFEKEDYHKQSFYRIS